MVRLATGILIFSKRKGGAERSVLDLCTSLANEGHEVHVYTEQWDEQDQGVHFHRIKTVPFPKSLRLLSFAIRATRAIEKGGYDLTLGVGNTLRADILQPRGGVHWAWFWRSLKAYDSPFIYGLKLLGRILSPKQWVGAWVEGAPYRSRNLSYIIAISDMIKQDMVHWYKIPEERIVVDYTRVDLERFHPRNRQYRGEIRRKHALGEEFVILFVSNNYKMKGLGYLIKALAKLKREGCPPFRLLVLGKDRQGPFTRLAKRAGVSEEVVFVGSTEEPEKYYGAADLLVHPTFYDACSRVVLEAMASGLPVITTESNGASGMVTDGREGFVIEDPRDIETFSKRIAFFWDEERRREVSSRCRNRIERYIAERDYPSIGDLLQRYIDKKEKRSGRGPSGVRMNVKLEEPFSWSSFYSYRLEIRKRYRTVYHLKLKKKLRDVVIEELKDGDKVLDVGAHDRSIGEKLKAKLPSVIYKSMDIDRAQAHDFYSFEEISESFHMILLSEVIEHLEFGEGISLLGRLHRLLDSGGKLILSTPNLHHPNRYWDSDHKTPYRYDEIGGALLSVGFEVDKMYRIYNDQFFKKIFRIYVASFLHQYLDIDFAKSIVVVAVKR